MRNGNAAQRYSAFSGADGQKSAFGRGGERFITEFNGIQRMKSDGNGRNRVMDLIRLQDRPPKMPLRVQENRPGQGYSFATSNPRRAQAQPDRFSSLSRQFTRLRRSKLRDTRKREGFVKGLTAKSRTKNKQETKKMCWGG